MHDRLIWSLSPGDQLRARNTLREGYAPDGAIFFTAGHCYPVVRILLMREPPAAVVIDDSGDENKIEPEFLVRHFDVVQPLNLPLTFEL